MAAASIAVIIPLLVTALSSVVWGQVDGSDRPNIIWIMADDLGYGDLGCYGQSRIQTPHLDRMASEGTRFTACYAGSPMCAPSRCVLMTGLHTGHARIRANVAHSGDVEYPPLLPEDGTIAEVLQSAGYVTGATGKWGLGHADTTGIPTRQGFDEWYGFLDQVRAQNHYPTFLWRDTKQERIEQNHNDQRKQYAHDLFTDFALDFIRRHCAERFFLFVAYTLPHKEYDVPEWAPAYADQPWPRDAKTYATMVSRVDRDVGAILAMLKELGLDERTIVFFCSDNGAIEQWDGLFDSSGPFRGGKFKLSEGGLRIPMIVRWPGRIEAGGVSDVPWYFADVMPTLAALAQAPLKVPTDGTNVLPLLLGRDQDLSGRFLYWEEFRNGFSQAVRHKHWKAIRSHHGTPLRLYDLRTDVSEKHDIAARHPQVIEELEGYLASARTDSPYWSVHWTPRKWAALALILIPSAGGLALLAVLLLRRRKRRHVSSRGRVSGVAA